ncbi:MAG: putative beta-lysine N-acetyltransferase [Geoalkalibacter sp.]|jgi:putative beta-lysine N-acetyltransferase|uniref:putative beta-lysine N-acetyltransferase n=1 Tax=Geoalkalibacter sp. TaxID=3041440 RepID=UPI003D0C728D
MQPDSLIRMTGALLQHGPASDRVYLMKLASPDVPRIIRFMEQLASTNGYSKLFAKVPGQAEGWFRAQGFKVEARVPGMFNGSQDGCFMAKYPKRERSVISSPKLVQEVLSTAREQRAHSGRSLPEGWKIETMRPADADAMADLYRLVFETYPFPIHDPAYLRSTMDSHVRYFGIRDDRGSLTALASAEMDCAAGNVEMTDFATLAKCRGKGLASILLAHMEKEMAKAGIDTAYTIARAHATGMNIVFARQGYDFAGTLPNNTQIKGDLESMNVWYKPLEACN